MRPRHHRINQRKAFITSIREKLVVKRNPDRVEPGLLHELHITSRDVLLPPGHPELRRLLRPKQRPRQRLNGPRRLRPAIQLQHVPFRLQPVAKAGPTQQQRFPRAIHQSLSLRMNKPCLRTSAQRQAEQRPHQNPQCLTHDLAPFSLATPHTAAPKQSGHSFRQTIVLDRPFRGFSSYPCP